MISTKLDYIVTYTSEEKSCQVCGEEFEVQWNASINDWVLMNTLIVRLTKEGESTEESCIMHPKCYQILAVQEEQKSPQNKTE